MVSIGQMVSATSQAGRAAATAVVGVGDGIAGGVVGGVSGVGVSTAEGLGLRRVNGVSALVTAAAVGAGIVGLVEWPVLAVAGGAVLVVSQLRGRPQPSTGSATAPVGTRPENQTTTKAAEPAVAAAAAASEAAKTTAKKVTAKRATPRKSTTGRATSSTSSSGSVAPAGRVRGTAQ